MVYEIKLSACGQTVRTISVVACEESDLYKAVGEMLLGAPCPAEIRVDEHGGSGMAEYEIRQRGTFVRGGITRPSIYVTERYNTLYLEPSHYEEAYLTCVNPESNNYKFYHLRPVQGGNGKTVSLGAQYGRIGSARGEAFGVKDLKDPYPPRLYWIRYYEKLSKGYIDQSDVFLGKPDNAESAEGGRKDPAESQENTDAPESTKTPEGGTRKGSWAGRLWQFLMACAETHVRNNIVLEKVTPGQVATAKERYLALCGESTLEGFNKALLALMSVSPRKARYVSDLLAKSVADFPGIRERESDLLKAMSAVAGGTNASASDSGADPITNAGIKVRPATDAESDRIKAHMPASLRGRVKKIWAIADEPEKARFEEYQKQTGIRRTIDAWHGSRSGNWASIVTTRLRHDANAPKTGNMLGGTRPTLYFAPFDAEGCQKSYGYTSGRGAYWTSGTSVTAIMGVYRLAYAPKYIEAGEYIKHFSDRELGRCNCVRARKGSLMRHGSPLRHDEIGMFADKAVLLTFLVELGI